MAPASLRQHLSAVPVQRQKKLKALSHPQYLPHPEEYPEVFQPPSQTNELSDFLLGCRQLHHFPSIRLFPGGRSRVLKPAGTAGCGVTYTSAPFLLSPPGVCFQPPSDRTGQDTRTRGLNQCSTYQVFVFGFFFFLKLKASA